MLTLSIDLLGEQFILNLKKQIKEKKPKSSFLICVDGWGGGTCEPALTLNVDFVLNLEKVPQIYFQNDNLRDILVAKKRKQYSH